MAHLSEAEKQELLVLSRSGELRDDMEKLRNHQKQQQAEYSLDDYLQFLNDMNELTGHKQRPFKPITGKHFIL